MSIFIRRLLIAALLISVFSCYQVERNCKSHHTGSYLFTYIVDGKEQVSSFKRTETHNIDYMDGSVDSSSIRWINDCEFVLKKLHPKNMAEEKAIHMKILTTTDTSYTFEYQLAVKESNKAPRVEKGTAIKLKE